MSACTTSWSTSITVLPPLPKVRHEGNLVAGANIAGFEKDRFRYDEPGIV